MKFLQFFFALSLVLFFASCTDDDDITTNDELIGTWEATFFDANIDSSTELNGIFNTSNSAISSSNLNYRLTFTENEFTTEGSYDITVVSSTEGMVFNTTNSSLTDVMGDGTYTVDGDQITTMGPFFTFEANGMSGAAGDEGQTATFEINSNGELIFTQDEEMTSTNSGVTTTSIIRSNSTWQRI